MKYTWEEEDFGKNAISWGIMATLNDEIVIISVDGKQATSLRDGYAWSYETVTEMVKTLNDHGYKPLFAQVNPSVIIKQAMKNNFNYGKIDEL